MNNQKLESEKMSLASMNIAEEKRQQLKQIFPEIFCEDKIDFDQLKRVLGEWVEPNKERFGLTWPGKAECMKTIQQPSLATLKPCREESVNFDETENVFIEGENLQVLKLLQKTYFGKVKMIYIDPPYNTGNDFIYPDDYKDLLNQYMRYTGQVDDDGRKFSTNTETSGRFHSKWLNMMYLRLYIARQLLRDDGVIFISIDGREQSYLKILCDPIFGRENFVTQITREAIKGGSQSKHIRICHDYILIYAKDMAKLQFSGYEGESVILNLEDEKGLYAKGRELNKWGADSRREDAPGMWFSILGPNGEEVYPIRNDGTEGRWRLGKQKLLQMIKDGDVIFEKRLNGTYEKIRDNTPKVKQFTTLFKDSYINAKGNERIKALYEKERSYFDYAKPIELVYDLMIMVGIQDSDIILDFFAGSATTADAILAYNNQTKMQARFVLVQLPEPCDEQSEAYKAGYKTIADIAKERIRRAAQKIAEENSDKTQNIDLGFKVF